MRDTIRFYSGHELISLSGFDPQLTVLEWLRVDAGRTGTKEGCAEGDCGACTVLVGRIQDGQLRYQAVNACIQPLATLDGCHLLSVEDLAKADGELHPVQQAMVDYHGSQCGFCTPGFVMSMAAIYHDPAQFVAMQIEDVLAGNLCRCTGYGPILEAVHSLTPSAETADQHPFAANMGERLAALDDQQTFGITADSRQFFAPTSLSELLTLRDQYPAATIIAGSTDTGLWITKQHRDLGTQIWLGRVAELATIEMHDEQLVIGAGVTYSASFDAIAGLYKDAGELWRRIASVQIRNAGTIGGNIANGSPIGDTPPFLIAIGAKLRLASVKGRREIPLEDFFIDYGKQDLAAGEIVEAIILPKPTTNWRLKVYKISKRFDQDISAVCAAFYIHVEDGRVTDARIAFGGMAATPKRAAATEACLIGCSWSRNEVEIAMATIANDFEPISDMRASADYRLKVARNLLLKCFIETTTAEQLRLAGQVRSETVDAA